MEDAQHLMTRCGWETYRTIRRRWHEIVKKKNNELSPELDASFVATVEDDDEVLQEGTGRSGLTAWDAAEGRIPEFWTADAENLEIKKEEYEKWLSRWYGACIREYMWDPLWQASQRKEKEQEASSAAVAASRLGGSSGSRKAVSGPRGGSRWSYRDGLSGIARSRRRRCKSDK